VGFPEGAETEKRAELAGHIVKHACAGALAKAENWPCPAGLCPVIGPKGEQSTANFPEASQPGLPFSGLEPPKPGPLILVRIFSVMAGNASPEQAPGLETGAIRPGKSANPGGFSVPEEKFPSFQDSCLPNGG